MRTFAQFLEAKSVFDHPNKCTVDDCDMRHCSMCRKHTDEDGICSDCHDIAKENWDTLHPDDKNK